MRSQIATIAPPACAGSKGALRTGLLAALTMPVIACGQASPPVCSNLPGTPQEISSTPRADLNLELMALRRSDGITADQTVYDRLVRDVAAIRSLDAEMRALDYRPPYEPGALLVSLDAKTHELVKAGKYHAWDCANERYHLSAVEPEETHVKLQFKGNLEMEKLAEVYKAFPGVSSAEPNRTTASDPLFALCATPDTHTWHYVFAESDAGLPKLHHFSVLGDGAVSGGETWSSKDAGAKPEWVDRFWNKNSCR